MTQTPLLRVRDLDVRFDTGDAVVPILRGVDLDLERGSILGVVGESGSGKSVLAKTIMSILPPTARVSGSMLLDGEELAGAAESVLRGRRGRDMAMVFQDPLRALNPTLKIGSQISEVLCRHMGSTRREARARTIELLESVELPEPAARFDQYPHQLSGGMRQRVVIAMALACQPKLIIADEPTTALDVSIQHQIIRLLDDLRQRTGTSIIFITHDLALASTVSDSIAVMYAGRIVEQGPLHEVMESPRMPYTRALLDASRGIDGAPHELIPTIGGIPPNPGNLPAGCAFSPRCPDARDDCRVTDPVLTDWASGRRWACWHPVS